MRTTAVRPFLFVLFSVLAIAQLTVFVVGLRLGSDGRADFRTMYTAGYMLRAGQRHDLYNVETEYAAQKKIVSDSLNFPFIHPAAEAVLFWPLSFLTYRVAYFVFAVVNMALLVAVAILVYPYLPRLAAAWKPLPFAIFLCYLPAGFVIVLGQTQLFVLLLISLAFVADRRGKDFSAGTLLGFTIIRFEIALPIAVLFLVWKRWRTLQGFLVSASVVLTVSMLLVGLRQSLAYAQTLYSMATMLARPSNQVASVVFPGTMPNIRGLTFEAGLHGTIGVAVTIVASMAILGFAGRRPASLPLAITVALLIGYHNHIEDLALVTLPVAILFEEGSWLAAGFALFSPIFYGSLVSRELLSLMGIPTIVLLFTFAGGKKDQKDGERALLP